ncbi:hypothetical protein [Kitasatospora sp. NBC_00315]|uniref:hypothetical protein n=1 Tax=Kitasatospora sp. NBC_00315 TaxID=2975963 RepID=UPI003250C84E
MSRGRHRHSSVLGRIAPPTAAAVLVVAAVTALVFSQDPVLVRSVGVAAVLAALGITLLLRQRDRAARAAAEVAAAQRMRAEERFEEQLAETEYAAEVAEERATRFGRRLTAEKSRLAKAETEIARLLRERAVMVAEQALKEAEATQRALAAARPRHPATPAAYVRAASVLRHLARQAAALEEQRERVAGAELSLRARPVPATTAPPAARPVATAAAVVAEKGVPALAAVPVAAPAPVAPAQPVPGASVSAVPAAARAAQPGLGARAVGASPLRPVLTATVEQLGGAPAAVLRPERQRPRTSQSGRGQNFSFFGRGGAAVRAVAPAPAVGSVSELGERADLADVLGDEAVAESALFGAPEAAGPEQVRESERPQGLAPEVVDLSADDDTEYIELPALRAGR